ncbi:translation initiation factor IF-2 subunit beta [Picrophilus oshimae]|uniref:Translation initiation factor 2 subunit beta n=1 Tax=Picrophilus torridus (strain ATCC 700027 / DSM 9790 / JCM 10055 / NBRC 100828 / KAW 2/3) TaxID=1122961 RepID=A0A8G2L7N0_PICTO|nr:translation initiation factor IF-2 subunit beta [Picrophilus oshimae]SMD31180.1 translation initiation factor 2 subunit beta (aeIF-2b) [Picrophilus oshimae DSM 9789]
MNFDYNKLLERASGVLSSKTKNESRLKIPEPDVIYEGKSTIIRNFIDITEMMNRDPEDVIKYLTKEFGIGAVLSGQRLIINRKVSEDEIQSKMNEYMATYVICYECKSPDTEIQKIGRTYLLVCKACGAQHPIRSNREIIENSNGIEIGKEYTVTIESTGSAGEGIARYQGYTIYVPKAKKDERVKIIIRKIKRNVAIAELADKK